MKDREAAVLVVAFVVVVVVVVLFVFCSIWVHRVFEFLSE